MNDSEYDDTPENAPVLPRSQRVVDAQKAREIRESPPYKKLKERFRDDCSRQRNPDGTSGASCWLCGDKIDYKLSYPHPHSWSVDHKITVKENPSLVMDLENFAPSHLDCNLRRGTDEPNLDIGQASRDW